MAMAMMGGLIAATILTLTFLPALYASWLRAKFVAPANAADGLAEPARDGPVALVRLQAAE